MVSLSRADQNAYNIDASWVNDHRDLKEAKTTNYYFCRLIIEMKTRYPCPGASSPTVLLLDAARDLSPKTPLRKSRPIIPTAYWKITSRPLIAY